MFGTSRRTVRVAATVTAALALAGGGFAAHDALAAPARPGGDASVQADPVHFHGGAVSAVDVREDNSGQDFAADDAYHAVLHSSTTVVIPSGHWRLVSASFSGQTYCTGGGYCSLRITAQKAGSSTLVELYPRGTWAIDAGSTDLWESHAVDRSKTLAPGTYTIRAEAAGFAGSTFQLGAWHQRVVTYQP